MDSKDIKTKGPTYSTFDDEDNASTFGREADTSAMMDSIYMFGDNDDSFMDCFFDFERVSSSPETQTGGLRDIPSPGLPTIKTSSPKKPEQANKGKAANHKAQSIRYSMASTMNGAKTAGPREVSSISAIATSHDSSPAANFFSSPLPTAGRDFTNVMNGTVTAPTGQDGPPSPVQFGGPMAQPVPIQQQMPMFRTTPFNLTARYELRIMPTPLKSRVETQIPIKMILFPLPPGVTKLHLPPHTISKPKLLAKSPPKRSPDMLELHATLVCTSAMEQPGLKQKALERATKLPQGHPPESGDENSPQNGGNVRICQGCITRERKRAARRKLKNPEDEKSGALDEERRVIVFNTQEVKQWQPLSGVMDSSGRPETVASNLTMQIDAPMRIACYCRHHDEKMGFNVIFTIKDFLDRVIAQAMSNPIMITDDHKTHPMAQPSSQSATFEPVIPLTVPVTPSGPMDANNLVSPAHNGGLHMSPSESDLASAQRNGQQASYASSASGKTTPTMSTATAPTRTVSRPPSRSQGGLTVKKKSGGIGSRVPNGLPLTRLETSPPPAGSQTASTQLSTATSPFFLNPANGPPTPGSNDQAPFRTNNRSASMDKLAIAQLYSVPTSSNPSRAPSPNGLRSGVNISQSQFTQNNDSSLYSLRTGVKQPRPPPIIHKIIPNKGPKMGGIEVSMLGQAFFQGLEVWFGDQKAVTTTYWGDATLVCLLHPSPIAGAVAVTLKHQGVAQSFPMAKGPPIFNCIDNNEDRLIRTALSVLAHKMSGQIVDISGLARRILNDGSWGWPLPHTEGKKV